MILTALETGVGRHRVGLKPDGTAPMRQGVHLPQDSMAQNSIAKRACCAISAVSSNTTMPPWPIIAPIALNAS